MACIGALCFSMQSHEHDMLKEALRKHFFQRRNSWIVIPCFPKLKTTLASQHIFSRLRKNVSTAFRIRKRIILDAKFIIQKPWPIPSPGRVTEMPLHLG